MQAKFLVFFSLLVVLSWVVPNNTSITTKQITSPEQNCSPSSKNHKYRLGFLGIHPDPNYQILVKHHVMKRNPIPEFFDARTNWPKCRETINNIRDQGECSSCWVSSQKFKSDTCDLYNFF